MLIKRWKILGEFMYHNSAFKHLSQLVLRTAIGLKVKDGIVLAVEKLVHSKLLVPEANRRIQTVDKHVGLVRVV